MSDVTEPETGEAAGVPYVVVPPARGARPGAPVVVAWHLLDAPRTEAAFAAALPLEGLDAWRVYLGLPLSGSRLPAGGVDEVMRLGYSDAVLNLHGPINVEAAAELGPALAVLGERFGLGDGRLGLLGGSAGAGVALEVMAGGEVGVDAAVLVSPVARLRPLVDALGAQFGVVYPWSPASEAEAARMDYVTRSGEIAAPVRLVLGLDDHTEGILTPARELRDALAGRVDTDMVEVPGMAHALAEEPGIEPAPQTPHATTTDAHAVAWFRQYLDA